MKTSLLALSVVLLVCACTGFTKIGDGVPDGGAGAGGASSVATCNHKPCGASCPACDSPGFVYSRDGSTCPQGYCDGTGLCASGYPACTATQCQSDNDCPQLDIPCQQCTDGSFACPLARCVGGQCVGQFPACSGSPCSGDSQCPQNVAPCQTCTDGSTSCPWARCENGRCANGIDTCPGATDPCAGKTCGEACSTCPPGATCPAVAMYCDANGGCQYDVPACSSGVCTSSSDCPAVGACPKCPDGSCAAMSCVNGACQFTCASADAGKCSASGDSCANGATCCSGLKCCSGSPFPAGQETCMAICPVSDRNLKRDFASVDQEEILERLSRLRISTWGYRTESARERHIGPMAQDFMSTFQVGSDDRTILQVDGDGVSFAAIQALYARLVILEQKNAALEREVQRLRRH